MRGGRSRGGLKSSEGVDRVARQKEAIVGVRREGGGKSRGGLIYSRLRWGRETRGTRERKAVEEVKSRVARAEGLEPRA